MKDGPHLSTPQDSLTPSPVTPDSRDSTSTSPQPLDERCRIVYRELQSILEEVFRKKHVPIERLNQVRILLDASFDFGHDEVGGNNASQERFVDELFKKVHELAQDHSRENQAFPVGKVHCFWCGSFDCAHSVPPEPRFVFKGYTPTGEPTWTEFGALALDLHHPHVHSMYGKNPSPITMVVAGSELTQDQLSVYGKHSNLYRVLGQVLIGYLPCNDRQRSGPQGRGRVALTVQAVETNHLSRRVHMNVVGVFADRQLVAPFLEESFDSRLCDALANARSKLAEFALHGGNGGGAGTGRRLRGRGRNRYADRERRVLRILRRLARNIDQISRQSTRRTNHSQERHRNRGRPASTALRDALGARREAIFRDTREGTWVVVGPRNRVHIFNDGGQHVTSVIYPGETIRKRTTLGKWKSCSEEERVGFQDRLRRSSRIDRET